MEAKRGIGRLNGLEELGRKMGWIRYAVEKWEDNGGCMGVKGFVGVRRKVEHTPHDIATCESEYQGAAPDAANIPSQLSSRIVIERRHVQRVGGSDHAFLRPACHRCDEKQRGMELNG